MLMLRATAPGQITVRDTTSNRSKTERSHIIEAILGEYLVNQAIRNPEREIAVPNRQTRWLMRTVR